MVFTGRFRSFTMAMPTSTAMRLPGMSLLMRGQMRRTARHTAPTSAAQRLTVSRLRKKQAAFSMVSMGFSG